MTIEFQPWPKTPRFNRDVIITEKIDGTNAAIIVEEVPEHMLHTAATGARNFDEMLARLQARQGVTAMAAVDDSVYWVAAQSRKRLITPGANTDNAGFAGWVAEHAEDLARVLGTGRHFGEWWGSGIQRGYGLPKGEKRFSLFNVERYAGLEGGGSGLGIVPELYRGPLSDEVLENVDYGLRAQGSVAAPGYSNAEGFIIFHTAAQQVFKVLLEGDDTHKGES